MQVKTMHLLYLDDSGSAEAGNGEYLVLGGVSLYERQIVHITKALDMIAERIFPNDSGAVEFHASEIFSGRVAPWNALKDKTARQEIIKEVLQVVRDAYDTARVFASVVHKKSYPAQASMEIAFEDICTRFDRYLARVDEKGLLVLDESAHATSLSELAHKFRRVGGRWGVLRNIVDGPMFVSSRAFRCIQVADHIAYAVFRRYESRDANYFDIISGRFDSERNVLHGLGHLEQGRSDCMCIGCFSRRR